MPLSRGEGPIRGVTVDAYPATVHAVPAVVIAIAESVHDRLRIAEAIGDRATVVMVATRAQAVEILNGIAASPPEPQLEPLPELPARPVGPVGVVGVEIDSDSRVAWWKGRQVGLSPLEHDLLVCLLEEVGHVRSFADLQHRVWGNDHLGDRSHVQSVVKRLRRKLHGLDSPLEIDAVRGVGLRLLDTRRHRTHAPAQLSERRTGTNDY